MSARSDFPVQDGINGIRLQLEKFIGSDSRPKWNQEPLKVNFSKGKSEISKWYNHLGEVVPPDINRVNRLKELL